MKIIDLTNKANAIKEIMKRVKISRKRSMWCDDSRCLKISFYLNPKTLPKKVSKLINFTSDFSRYLMRKLCAEGIFSELLNKTEFRVCISQTYETSMCEMVKIRDVNLIGLADY